MAMRYGRLFVFLGSVLALFFILGISAALGELSTCNTESHACSRLNCTLTAFRKDDSCHCDGLVLCVRFENDV